MKRLSLILAIILGMGTMAFSQDVEVYEEAGLFGKGNRIFRSTDEMPMIDFNHAEDDDQNADPAPLGTGILLLAGMGAAYLLKNKKKD